MRPAERLHADGDKDTFRAAFFLAGNLSSFYQVEYPLGLMLHQEEVGGSQRAATAAATDIAAAAAAAASAVAASLPRHCPAMRCLLAIQLSLSCAAPHAPPGPRSQGGFRMRGYLQPHPNGTAMFVHRVAGEVAGARGSVVPPATAHCGLNAACPKHHLPSSLPCLPPTSSG